MTIVNGYCTLDALKARLGLPSSNTSQDVILEGIIEAVSRAIDEECGTQFYAATQTRYFTATCSDHVLVDDLLSVTTLKTDTEGDGTWETTWASTDYVLAPYNAQLQSQPRPYWKIEAAPNGTKSFPVGVAKGVQIAGSWGFCSSTPKAVEAVCARESVYHFSALKQPAASSALMEGTSARQIVAPIGLSENSKMLLAQYRRVSVG